MEKKAVVRRCRPEDKAEYGYEWCVYSEKGKLLGGGKTKEEAMKRLRQVEYFKRKKSELINVAEEICKIAEDLLEDNILVLNENSWQYFLDKVVKEFFDYLIEEKGYKYVRSLTEGELEEDFERWIYSYIDGVLRKYGVDGIEVRDVRGTFVIETGGDFLDVMRKEYSVKGYLDVYRKSRFFE